MSRRKRDLVEILDQHERDIARLRGTLARIGQGASNLGDLSDVDLTGIATDDFLKWDGANWVPSEVDLSAYLPLAGGNLTGQLELSSGLDNPILFTAGAGPMGIGFAPNGTLEGQILYRTSGDAVHFEDESENKRLSVYMRGIATDQLGLHLHDGEGKFEFTDAANMHAQIRLTKTSDPNSVLLRNDGASMYFLVTDTEDGSWNGLRPFYFSLSTGDVTMSHDIIATGGDKNFNGGTTTTATTSLGNTTARGYIDFDGTGTSHEVRWDADSGIYSASDGNITGRANGVSRFAATTTGLRIYQMLYSSSVSLPGIHLDSPNSGDDWTAQGAIIAMGESATTTKGNPGSAAGLMMYRGNGYFLLGNGDHSSGYPSVSGAIFKYNVEGLQMYSGGDTSDYITLQHDNYIDANEATIRSTGGSWPTSSAASYDLYTRNDSADWGEIYRYSSSARYKQDINPFEGGGRSALDFIMAVEPVVYRDIEEANSPNSSYRRGRVEVGFIAEQIAEVEPWPEMFTVYDKHYPEDMPDDWTHVEGGRFDDMVPESVKYKQFVVPIVAAMQEMAVRLEAVEAELGLERKRHLQTIRDWEQEKAEGRVRPQSFQKERAAGKRKAAHRGAFTNGQRLPEHRLPEAWKLRAVNRVQTKVIDTETGSTFIFDHSGFNRRMWQRENDIGMRWQMVYKNLIKNQPDAAKRETLKLQRSNHAEMIRTLYEEGYSTAVRSPIRNAETDITGEPYEVVAESDEGLPVLVLNPKAGPRKAGSSRVRVRPERDRQRTSPAPEHEDAYAEILARTKPERKAREKAREALETVELSNPTESAESLTPQGPGSDSHA